MGLETPEDNQSYCKYVLQPWNCLIACSWTLLHHSSNPVEYYCDLLNALQWVQPRVAAREVMCRVPLVNFHNLLIYLLWLTSTIQIWNLTPIFKALLYPSHLALWVISQKMLIAFLWVISQKMLIAFLWVISQKMLYVLFFSSNSPFKRETVIQNILMKNISAYP